MPGKLEEDDQLVSERKIMQSFAEAEWQEKGTIEPMAVVHMTRNPETGERFTDGYGVGMVPGFFQDDRGKDMFAGVVKKLCVVGDASAVGMISETYQLRIEALEGETHEEATKRIMGMRGAQNGSIKGLPGTVEMLMMVWEHHSFKGSQIWMAEIMREIPGDENSPGTLGPWVTTEGDEGTTGRFANLLQGAGTN